VSYTPDAASSSTYNGASGTIRNVLQGYVLTVNSDQPASGVSIQVTYPRRLLPARARRVLRYPAQPARRWGHGAGHCERQQLLFMDRVHLDQHRHCNVTLNGNMTVTVNYAAAKTTPTVTVTPASSSVTTAQRWR